MPEPMLELNDVVTYYGPIPALKGISLHVRQGEIVCLLGGNASGKSTTMKTILGVVRPHRGSVSFEDDRIDGLPPQAIVRRGIALVPEGRRLFPSLTVEENLLMGAAAGRAGPWNLERVYRLFPILGDRRDLPGTALSGGQQQMAALGRALMSNPRVLLCDELSLGLAPIVIREIYQALPTICAEGMTVVIVEQDVGMARQVSGRIYCFQEGRVSLHGPSDTLTREQISRAYFGV